MSRWTTMLAAASASAAVTAAAVALPAVGSDSTSSGAAPTAVAAKRAACLKVTAPEKCKASAPGPEVADLIACARDHGLDAPSDPAAFKQWVSRTEASDPDALKRVIGQCKMALSPPDEVRAQKEKLAGCGADVTKAGAPKAEAPGD